MPALETLDEERFAALFAAFLALLRSLRSASVVNELIEVLLIVISIPIETMGTDQLRDVVYSLCALDPSSRNLLTTFSVV